MKNIAAIVLAAGKGTRMKSDYPKVLHRVAGRPMVHYPVRALAALGVKKTVVVVGYGSDAVRKSLAGEPGVLFADQKEQLGTGHAVMEGLKRLKGFKGDLFILSGDVPLIKTATLRGLARVKGSGKGSCPVALVSAILHDPSGYGRVVRDGSGAIGRIVEDRDATAMEKRIDEVNAGIYLISSDFLVRSIKRLGKGNVQGEYYLPDLVAMAASRGGGVKALTHLDPDEVMGVNNRVELARADRHMRQRLLEAMMLAGVTVADPDRTYIEDDVAVGRDTVIYPSVRLEGATSIGPDCVIEDGARVVNSVVGAGTRILAYSIIEDSVIGEGCSIGPFARLRPGNTLADGVRVGNFVEVKKTKIGRGTKANHLTYLGDSVIGEGVNIGAGTITCNYDGVKKHTTTIEDDAFIGSDTQLVAPVRVGRGAYVGSGTTVTKDVPAGSLVTTRAPERVVEGWVKRKGLDRPGRGR